jgi:macrolide transport system ATP-binding/permease protein
MSMAFSIKSLSKTYEMGEEKVVALDAVDLEVPAGDYVAIMGPSGSGKSTLLNLLGCLDSPTGGSYRLKGEEVTGLTDEQLSEVRCRSIGFVFQSYNLIPYLDVLDNVRMPRAYARGKIVFGNDVRHLVELVGLKDRVNHKPQQLSGGQQQRVGIARSLSNDPDFILADEPTGNLDSKTTHEVLNLLDELNSRGKTIVMVTHEKEVAARARRVLVMKDGKIEKEECARPLCDPTANTSASAQEAKGNGDGFGKKAKRVWRNLGKAALLSIVTRPMRSFLTAIGVFIGVASVIWLLAIGEGIAAEAEGEIMALGANNLILSSKRPSDEERSTKGKYFYSYGLTKNDFAKISNRVPHLSAAYPTREINNRTIFSKHARTRAELLGCLPNFKDLHKLEVTKGRFLTHEDNLIESEVCVISTALSRTLFPFGDALGQSINIGGNLYEVVGEVAPRFELKDESNQGFKELFEDNVYLPLETMWSKVFDYYYRGYDGSPLLSKITLTVDDPEKLVTIAQMIRDILASDHGIEDYMVTVPLELMEQAEKAKMTFVALMGLVAGISLLVGGVGIMNIMLATVTERTREIGIRRALGARRSDIVMQFLLETIALTGLGGILGILIGLLCEPAYGSLIELMERFTPSVYESLPPSMKGMTPEVVYWSLPAVFGIAVLTGVIFGIYPARRAAKMNPVDALRHVS